MNLLAVNEGCQVKGSISQRVLRILQYCFEHNFLKTSQVEVILRQEFVLDNGDYLRLATHRLLISLVNNEFLEVIRPSFQLYKFYNVTSKGLSILQDYGLAPDNSQYRRFDETMMNHDCLVTDIRLQLNKTGGCQDWSTERGLKSLDKDAQKIPDLEMTVIAPHSGRRLKLGIEVELNRKTNYRYKKIFEIYRNSDYEFIFYFVRGSKLMPIIHEISKNITNKIYTANLDDFFQNGPNTHLKSHCDEFCLGAILLK